MSCILTSRQADELHKLIIAYLSANNLPNDAAALRAELSLGNDVFGEVTTKKYDMTTATLDPKSRNAALQFELDNATPTSLPRRNQDPDSWLPRSPPRHSLESHRDIINCVAFHPIFSSITSGSNDYAIKVWDYELGELERTIKGHTREVLDVDYSGPRGGILLASCSSDSTIKLISAIRFMPSGVAGEPPSGSLLDVTTWYCVKTLQGHTGDDMTARLWNISASDSECKQIMVGHEHYNECCVLALPSSTLVDHDNWVQALVFHPSGKYLLSVSDDKTLRRWDSAQEGKCVNVLSDAHERFVSCLRWARGSVKDISGAEEQGTGAAIPDVKIYCVIATGGVDSKLRIFAN
ncbi:WD40-repeat-containing domain protein [Bisporella sp. PMI_857]|nr:WD40-repeat-containing domain protein [Bisporella sp. PMI_857]